MFLLEIKDVVAVRTQAAYTLYLMFKEDVICYWSYLFCFLLKGKFSP